MSETHRGARRWLRRWLDLPVSNRIAEVLFWGGIVAVVAYLLTYPRWSRPEMGSLHAMVASVLAAGALYLYLLRIVLSTILFWPLPPERLQGHWMASRRYIVLVLALWGQMVAVAMPEFFILLRAPEVPLVQRLLSGGLLMVYALPLWLILLFPRRWSRQAVALRPPRKPRVRGRKGWKWAGVPVWIREIREGLARYRKDHAE